MPARHLVECYFMKPPPFEDRAPETLDEAVALLAADPAAKPIAGGQSLIPVLAFRLASPKLLLDLCRLPGLGDMVVDVGPSQTNPLSIKGAGEGGIIRVGGLMANAVAGALSSMGAWPNELPLSPPRVWRLANPSQEGE